MTYAPSTAVPREAAEGGRHLGAGTPGAQDRAAPSWPPGLRPAGESSSRTLPRPWLPGDTPGRAFALNHIRSLCWFLLRRSWSNPELPRLGLNL